MLWITGAPVVALLLITKHPKISEQKDAFSTHHYLSLLEKSGGKLYSELGISPNDPPQQLQETIRQRSTHSSDGSDLTTANTELITAVDIGRHDLVEEHLAKGSDVNKQGMFGWYPLLIAVAHGYPKMVKLLLEKGANPDLANLKAITPLMYAARYGNLEITKLLLDYRPALNLQEVYGETAVAVAVMNNHESIVRLLISKGAKIDTKNKLGLTPLDIAHKCGYGKIARILRKKLPARQ